MLSSSTLVFLAAMLMSFDGYLALTVTSPSGTSAWNLQTANTITWTSVATDPSTFDIVLVNNDPSCAPTGMSQTIKQNVATADGKYQMSDVPSTKACAGYQINLVAPSTSNNGGGILAQSAQFTVTDGKSAITQTNGTSSSAQANNATMSTQTNLTNSALSGTNSTMNTTSTSSMTPVNQSYSSNLSGSLSGSTSTASKTPSNFGSSSANSAASESSTGSLISFSLKSLVANLMFTTFLLVLLS